MTAPRAYVWGYSGWGGEPYIGEYGAQVSLDLLVAEPFDPATTPQMDLLAAKSIDPAVAVTPDLLAAKSLDPAETVAMDMLTVKVFETLVQMDMRLQGPADPAVTITPDLLAAESFDPATTPQMDLLAAKSIDSAVTVTPDLLAAKSFDPATTPQMDLLAAKSIDPAVTVTPDLLAAKSFDPAATPQMDLLAAESFDPASTPQMDVLAAEFFDPATTPQMDLLASGSFDPAITPTLDLILVKWPYIYIANTDLSGLASPFSSKAIGGWDIKSSKFPDKRYVRNVMSGANQPVIPIELFWTQLDGGYEAAMDDLYDIVNNGPGSRLYTRNSLWFYKVDKVTKKAIPTVHSTDAKAEIDVYLKCDRLYCQVGYDFDTEGPATLPQSSAAFYNFGHFVMPAESITFITYHNGTYHVEDLLFSVADGNSMTITDKGLDGEEFTLADDLDGSVPALTAVYEDSVASGTPWSRNFTGDGTFSTDHIHLGNSESAYCDLAGPYPTKSHVVLEIKMAYTGDPAVEVSLDGGVSYETAIQAADMQSSTTTAYTYYLAETKNESDIRLRFTCDSNDTLDIYYMKITRYLDVSSADIPSVPVGSTKAFTVSCDTGKSKSVDIDGTFRTSHEGF